MCHLSNFCLSSWLLPPILILNQPFIKEEKNIFLQIAFFFPEMHQFLVFDLL